MWNSKLIEIINREKGIQRNLNLFYLKFKFRYIHIFKSVILINVQMFQVVRNIMCFNLYKYMLNSKIIIFMSLSLLFLQFKLNCCFGIIIQTILSLQFRSASICVSFRLRHKDSPDWFPSMCPYQMICTIQYSFVIKDTFSPFTNGWYFYKFPGCIPFSIHARCKLCQVYISGYFFRRYVKGLYFLWK